MKPHQYLGRVAVIVGLAVTIAACAGPGPRPDGKLATAEASIQRAEATDAREFNPILLNDAQSKVEDARELIEKERYKEAELLLEQAEVDARLAGARSETDKARDAVMQLNQNIETLRQQMQAEQQ
ncbi:DUF4398 domain-containing protein [Marinobacter changyiensis]|uniref:DUF4398 domain-containing protein n=1 Tax=Marinobacter changyiensis TaxID=2604091 RepID=UPI0012647D92|nr:DUF4398 domain-containing protein [Marinobacter changyiensis]